MQNNSGIRPVEYNVLINQDEAKSKTASGLHLPDEIVERDRHGQTRGVIVAVSGLAFNEDVWPKGEPKPEPGQRIAFAKHAGTFVTGTDGHEYRVVKDKDVVALIEGE